MDKGKFLLMGLLFFSFILTGWGLATAESSFSPDGNARKGKYLYRKTCRNCHDGSKAKDLQPNTNTQAQWKRAFNKHERFECAEEWQKHSDSDLNDIYTYLHDHAYDSPQPATCG